MHTHAGKTQKNKSQSVANEVAQKQGGNKPTFQFVDNRPEAIAQRKLQDLMNNSPQVKQLKAFQEMANNRPQTKQAAQLKAMMDNYSSRQRQPIQKKENKTGLLDNLITIQKMALAHNQQQINRMMTREIVTNEQEGVIQKRILPLGDLAELQKNNQQLTEEQEESGRTITKGVEHREKNFNERVERPWNTKGFFAKGALADMGIGEPLRIYGHGAAYEGDDFVTMVGGYTVVALAQRIINLGLPATYKGTIYLTGCETGKGGDNSFLKKFYDQIKTNIPEVHVEGNPSVTVTFKDGMQGVFKEDVSSEEYDSKINSIHKQIDSFRNRNKGIIKDIKALEQKIASLEVQRQNLIGQNLPHNFNNDQTEMYIKQEKANNDESDFLLKASGINKKEIESLDILKEDYIRKHHDTTGLLTIKYP